MKVHSFQRLCHNMLIDIHVNICLISWLYPRINLYRYRQISVAWNQQKLFVCLCLQALLELSPSWWQEHQGLAGAIFNLCRKGPHVFSQWWLNILHALTTSKSGNRKPTNSSSLIVLMHARLMVLSAHACTERESALINAGSPSHICDSDQPDCRLWEWDWAWSEADDLCIWHKETLTTNSCPLAVNYLLQIHDQINVHLGLCYGSCLLQGLSHVPFLWII